MKCLIFLFVQIKILNIKALLDNVKKMYENLRTQKFKLALILLKQTGIYCFNNNLIIFYSRAKPCISFSIYIYTYIYIYIYIYTFVLMFINHQTYDKY